MRVTIDIDTHNPLAFMLVIAKGLFLFKKLPEKITKTHKGFHFFWYDLDISEKKMFIYRYWIGDDKKRIALDMYGKKRLKQVMFKYKEVEYVRDDGIVKRRYKERVLYDLHKHKRGYVLEKLREKNPQWFEQ